MTAEHSISGKSTWNSIEIIPISEKNRQALSRRLLELRSALPPSGGSDVLAGTAAQMRQEFDSGLPCRLVLISGPREDTAAKIDAALSLLEKGDTAPQTNAIDIHYGEGNSPGSLAFLFPGQGSQYLNMARDLFDACPEAASIRQAVDHHFQGAKPLWDFINPEAAADPDQKGGLEIELRSTDVAQPAIGMVSLLMLKYLSRFNVVAEAAAGHSFGELCALCAAGCIDEEVLLELAVWRGRLMAAAGGIDKGTMLAVKAPLAQIDSLIRENGIDVILANRNAPDQGVLSGSTEAIEQMQAVCKEQRIRAMVLPVSAAFHSRLVEDAALPFQERLHSVRFSPGHIPIYANKTAHPYPVDPDSARRLLGEHLVNPVRFCEQIQNMYAAGVRTFVEVGPKSVLTGLVGAILKGEAFVALSIDGSSGRRSGILDLAIVLARLGAAGYPVDFRSWGK